jgi:hypothetical protein
MASQMRRLLVTALRELDEAARAQTGNSKRHKSRAGKKTIAGHFAPEAAWQLKKLALDRRATVQSLLEEALGDLFDKYHLPRV